MKKVEAYETTDGKVFKSENEAKTHQISLGSESIFYPYKMIIGIDVEVILDLKVSPSDSDLDDKVKNIFNRSFPNKGTLQALASYKLMYANILSTNLLECKPDLSKVNLSTTTS